MRAFIAAGIVLPDDYRIALVNIAACYFRYTTVSQACANEAWLNRFRADHNPDHLALSPLSAFAARRRLRLLASAALICLALPAAIPVLILIVRLPRLLPILRALRLAALRLAALRLALSLALLAALFHLLLQSLLLFFRKVRPEAQCGVGNRHYILNPRDRDSDIRCHAWAQFQIRVWNIDDRAVGHYVLQRLRVEPELRYVARKGLARISVNYEVCLDALFDLPNVCFINRSEHLHLCQVVGYREKSRRLKARGNGLAHVNIARYDNAVGACSA